MDKKITGISFKIPGKKRMTDSTFIYKGTIICFSQRHGDTTNMKAKPKNDSIMFLALFSIIIYHIIRKIQVRHPLYLQVNTNYSMNEPYTYASRKKSF